MIACMDDLKVYFLQPGDELHVEAVCEHFGLSHHNDLNKVWSQLRGMRHVNTLTRPCKIMHT